MVIDIPSPIDLRLMAHASAWQNLPWLNAPGAANSFRLLSMP